MNTKILLAIAGSAALTACSKTPRPEGWEFPLVESTRQVAARPLAHTPSLLDPSKDPFRLPDPTENLPNHRKRPAPRINYVPVPDDSNAPLSRGPATPPPTPLEAPEEIPIETGAPSEPPTE
jgi:hypothetical protein